MPAKVAVIGAGALGLMAMKNFKEDGFDVTGFESRPYVGGLWKDSADSTLSVHATTTFNSSKYRSAISDFPFSEDTDDFPTAPQMHKYLTSYSDHFGLTPHIHLNTKVVDLERAGDKWALTVQHKDEQSRTEYFDKIAISTGSFSKPKHVQFEGADKFAGDMIHAIDYRGPESYTNKNVLIVGVHASAQDMAYSLKDNANKAYMSHRTGLLLFPRYMSDGTAFDTNGGLRFVLIQTFMQTWLPRLWTWLFDKILLSVSKKSFTTRPEWKFLPAPSLAVASPLIADKLYSLLQSGFATPVTEIKRITGPKSVLLSDGTELYDIDAIIQCTGYHFATAFIPTSSPYQPYPQVGAPPYLYRNTFPLDPDPFVRTSLAFLGQVAITYPGFIAHELAAQSISQIWLGRTTLPSLPEMQQWHRDNAAWRAHTTAIYGESSIFYTAFVPFPEHFRWMDRTAGTGIFAHFDWAWFNWRSWRLWWSDRDLYNVCMNGLFTPSIFRLFDSGRRKAWSGAREQVFRDNEAAKKQKERKVREMQEKEKEKEKREEGGLNGHANGRLDVKKNRWAL